MLSTLWLLHQEDISVLAQPGPPTSYFLVGLWVLCSLKLTISLDYDRKQSHAIDVKSSFTFIKLRPEDSHNTGDYNQHIYYYLILVFYGHS